MEHLLFSLILDTGESQVESINWSWKQCTFIGIHCHNCIPKIWQISHEYLISCYKMWEFIASRAVKSLIYVYEISWKLLIISLKNNQYHETKNQNLQSKSFNSSITCHKRQWYDQLGMSNICCSRSSPLSAHHSSHTPHTNVTACMCVFACVCKWIQLFNQSLRGPWNPPPLKKHPKKKTSSVVGECHSHVHSSNIKVSLTSSWACTPHTHTHSQTEWAKNKTNQEALWRVALRIFYTRSRRAEFASRLNLTGFDLIPKVSKSCTHVLEIWTLSLYTIESSHYGTVLTASSYIRRFL